MGEPGWFQKQSVFGIITTVDQENYRVAWISAILPRFLLNTDRWQRLTVNADGKTKYETMEVFGGILAYIVMFLFRGKLLEGFNAQAAALKQWAERT